MHECGHGVYEHGVSQTLDRTPLAHGVSSALHESQSRLWENVVGRSRPFWEFFYPQLQDDVPGRARPRRSRALPPRREPRAAVVHPRRRRRGDLQPAHRPALRARAGAALGRPLDGRPARGVERALQGVPRPRRARTTGWACSRTSTGRAAASATSRPTRSATSSGCRSGSASAPSCRTSTSSSPAASSSQLHDWLREHVYRHGRKFTPQELLERLVGGGMDAGPYVRYLRDKFGALAAA